jgi:CRISPR-associated endonuclease/helicase Cas3
MADVYRRLFTADARPSLILAHGRRDQNKKFIGSLFEAGERVRELNEAGEKAQHACARWIADDRRKAFFGHVGVGNDWRF